MIEGILDKAAEEFKKEETPLRKSEEKKRQKTARFTADYCRIILEGVGILLHPSTMMAKRDADYYQKALHIKEVCERLIKEK